MALRRPMAAVAAFAVAAVPWASAAAAPLTATQARYVYYWDHDANFNAVECHELPASFLAACLTAVRLQLADPRTVQETYAQREAYAASFARQNAFPAADCPLLPARFVAACVAETAVPAALTCVGASGTVCSASVPAQPAPAGPTAASAAAGGAVSSSAGGAGAPPSGASGPGASGGAGSAAGGDPVTQVLESGLLGANPGQTVSFGSDPSSGADPTACALQPAGPTLIFSNDPERVPGPGLLYADTVSGNVRVFLYHVNASSGPLRFGAAVTDRGPGPATVYLERDGQAGPATGFLAVGKEAAHHWFQPFPARQFTLQSGESAWIDASLPEHVAAPGEAVNAIYDFTATAPVQVSVVAENGAQPASAAAAPGLPLLPNTQVNAVGTAMRGTFAGADPVCSLDVMLPWSGEDDLRFGAGNTVRSFLHGTSAVDGDAPVIDYGNYGVMYSVRLTLTNTPGSLWNRFAVMLHPHDNVFAGMAATVGGLLSPGVVPLPYDRPYLNNANQGVLLDAFNLLPYSPTRVQIDWMTSAGSSLPVDLLIYPMY